MRNFARDLVGVIFYPTAFCVRTLERPSLLSGFSVPFILGLTYSVFFTLLAIGGHQPSNTTGLPFDAETYYHTAAWYMPVLFPALVFLIAGICHGWSRMNGQNRAFSLSVHLFGFAYSAPLLLFYVLPDLMVYLVMGHAELGRFTLFYAPVAVILVIIRMHNLLVAGLGASRQAARFVTFLAGVAQAFPASLLIR